MVENGVPLLFPAVVSADAPQERAFQFIAPRKREEGEWYGFSNVRNTPQGRMLRYCSLSTGKFLTLPASKIPDESPFVQYILGKEEKEIHVLRVRSAGVTPKTLSAYMKRKQNASSALPNGVKKKKKRAPGPRGGKFNFIGDIDPIHVDSAVRSAFRSNAYFEVLLLYPHFVLNSVTDEQCEKIAALLRAGSDCVHLWAALCRKIPDLPDFSWLQSVSKTVSDEVIMAQKVYHHIYDLTERYFRTVCYGNGKLKEWGVLDDVGRVRKWAEQEQALLQALNGLTVDVTACLCFKHAFFRMIQDKLVQEGEPLVICPGDHIKEFLMSKGVHATRLKTLQTCVTHLSTATDVTIVMAERATLVELKEIASLIPFGTELHLVGDPRSLMFIPQRGSPMSGFLTICRRRAAQEVLAWPLFVGSPEEMIRCWQRRAEESVIGGHPEDVKLFSRQGAIKGLKSHYTHGQTAVLCFSPRLLVQAFKALDLNSSLFKARDDVAIHARGVAGIVSSISEDTITLGKEHYSTAFPMTPSRTNVSMAQRFIGTPMKHVVILIDRFTQRTAIAALLKYAILSCKIFVEDDDCEGFVFSELSA